MKTLRLFLAFSFVFLLHSASAQTPKSTEEKIQLLKVAYLTKKLDLTTTEAEKFWPIYNDYEDKREVAKKKLMDNRKLVKNSSGTGADTLSAASLEAIFNYEADFDENDAKLKRELNNRLKKVLPMRKIALLYVAEDEFKKELLRQVAEADKKAASDTVPPKKGN